MEYKLNYKLNLIRGTTVEVRVLPLVHARVAQWQRQCYQTEVIAPSSISSANCRVKVWKAIIAECWFNSGSPLLLRGDSLKVERGDISLTFQIKRDGMFKRWILKPETRRKGILRVSLCLYQNRTGEWLSKTLPGSLVLSPRIS